MPHWDRAAAIAGTGKPGGLKPLVGAARPSAGAARRWAQARGTGNVRSIIVTPMQMGCVAAAERDALAQGQVAGESTASTHPAARAPKDRGAISRTVSLGQALRRQRARTPGRRGSLGASGWRMVIVDGTHHFARQSGAAAGGPAVLAGNRQALSGFSGCRSDGFPAGTDSQIYAPAMVSGINLDVCARALEGGANLFAGGGLLTAGDPSAQPCCGRMSDANSVRSP